MIFGWDISTSVIGMSMFTDEGEYVSASFCDLRKVEGSLLDKADFFKEWLDHTAVVVNENTTNYHFIEERLGGFSGGRTSAQVLMKLGAFNTTCSYILWTQKPETHRTICYLHPSSWKAAMKKEGLIIPKGADKKELTLQYVRTVQPRILYAENKNGNPQPWCYDVADSYCIGRAGWRKLCSEAGS